MFTSSEKGGVGGVLLVQAARNADGSTRLHFFYKKHLTVALTPRLKTGGGCFLLDISVMVCILVKLMFKEKQIIEKYPFTKPELVKLRNTTFVKGEDWVQDPTTKGHTGAIMWTMKGMVGLLATKNVKIDNDIHPEEPAVAPTVNVEKVITVERCPAVIRRKHTNAKLIDCEIRGQIQRVKVMNNKFLRIGSIIEAVKKDGTWSSNVKTDERGRIL